MVLTLLWNKEPGVAAGSGAGAGAIPWSQHQQPGPALVLGAFLRALCNVVLTPSLPLVQASSVNRRSDRVSPETAVVLWIFPGSHLPLYTHQTLHSACWELSQLSLSSIFEQGWQFKRIPHNSVGCCQFNPASGPLATPAVPVGDTRQLLDSRDHKLTCTLAFQGRVRVCG